MATMPVAYTSRQAVEVKELLEDPLAHLPHSTVTEVDKGQTIYSFGQPSRSIYLVVAGRVKVSRRSDDGRHVVVDIYKPDELFGESALLNLASRQEQAIALENTQLMSWTAADIEDISTRRPRLAVALMQILVQRSNDLAQRIQSFAVDSIPQRLARSLIRFSDRLGTEQEDGLVRMPPFTHELISQYVGTSREIVTFHMNHFRKQGYVRYSRKEVVVNRDKFRQWLNKAA
jgi:CRP/FNR family transcriptional regulator, cyclic AMP receptor protein